MRLDRRANLSRRTLPIKNRPTHQVSVTIFLIPDERLVVFRQNAAIYAIYSPRGRYGGIGYFAQREHSEEQVRGSRSICGFALSLQRSRWP